MVVVAYKFIIILVRLQRSKPQNEPLCLVKVKIVELLRKGRAACAVNHINRCTVFNMLYYLVTIALQFVIFVFYSHVSNRDEIDVLPTENQNTFLIFITQNKKEKKRNQIGNS